MIEQKIASLKTSTRTEQFTQLIIYKNRVSKEFDRYLDQLRDGRDLIHEAIKRRMQLRRYRVRFFQYFTQVRLRHIVSAPFIYAMLVPSVFLHFFLELYHHICFRLYRIPLVQIRQHIVFDRGHLAYLNWFEKMNCIYCSYFNGLISYTREIAGRTERYWCPIKHAQRTKQEHSQQEYFVEYLDAKAYRENLENIRCFDKRE